MCACYIYIYACIYICVCACMYIYICLYIYVYTDVCGGCGLCHPSVLLLSASLSPSKFSVTETIFAKTLLPPPPETRRRAPGNYRPRSGDNVSRRPVSLLTIVQSRPELECPLSNLLDGPEMDGVSVRLRLYAYLSVCLYVCVFVCVSLSAFVALALSDSACLLSALMKVFLNVTQVD